MKKKSLDDLLALAALAYSGVIFAILLGVAVVIWQRIL